MAFKEHQIERISLGIIAPLMVSSYGFYKMFQSSIVFKTRHGEFQLNEKLTIVIYAIFFVLLGVFISLKYYSSNFHDIHTLQLVTTCMLIICLVTVLTKTLL
jgi:hypothetical protein